MTFSLEEIDHILKALNTMSSYDVARAREKIDNGVVNHDDLVDKFKMYRHRITWRQNNYWKYTKQWSMQHNKQNFLNQ